MGLPSCLDLESFQSSGAPSSWTLGVLTAAIAAVTSALGGIVLKMAMNHQERMPSRKQAREPIPGVLLSWRWAVGAFLLMILDAPLDLFAFTVAAESLIAPMSAVTLITTQFLGPWLLNERVESKDYLFGLVIVFGVLLTTIFGTHYEWEYTAEVHAELRTKAGFLICEGLVCASVLAVCVMVMLPAPTISPSISPVLFAYVAGALGAQQTLFMKGVGTIAWTAKTTADHRVAVIYGVVSAGLGLLQLSCMGVGAKKFDGVLFLPQYVAFYIILNIAVGGVYYMEFACFSTTSWIMFGLGCLITLGGLLGLTMHRYKLENSDEARASDDSNHQQRDEEEQILITAQDD